MIDGLRAQFVVPGFVAVGAAKPVLGAVLGQPRRGIERVQLHADLTILAKLACALSRARAVPLAA